MIPLLLIRILGKLLLTVSEVAIFERTFLPVYFAPHVFQLSLGLIFARNGILCFVLQRLKLVRESILLLDHLVFKFFEL